MSSQEIVRKSRDWYISKSFIPHIESRSFARMVGRSLSLVGRVAGMSTAAHFRLTVVDSPSAFINFENKVIGLPQFYFDPEFYERRFGTDVRDIEHLSLMTANGSIVHEALHALHTPKDVETLAMSSPKGAKALTKYGEAMGQACNLIEDLFIESHVPDDYEHFVNSKNEVLFSEDELVKVAENFQADSSLANAMSLAVMYKRVGLRAQKEFNLLPTPARQAITMATGLERVAKPIARANLAAMFVNCFPVPPESKRGEGPGEGKGGEATSKMAKAAAAAATKMAHSMAGKMFRGEVEASSESERRAIQTSGYVEVKTHGDHVSLIPQAVSLDVLEASSGWDSLPRLPSDNSWVQLLRSIRTRNHVPGQARVMGSKMVATRLYRIATDQKVMAHYDNIGREPGRVEVIILVDLSGSMGWVRTVDDVTAELAHLVLARAKSVFKALQEARIACSVYGHTSHGTEIPLLVHIASYDMRGANSTQIDERFDRATGVQKSQNYDGVIIAEVSKRFTTRPGAKFLIVLSDGQPAGSGYEPPAADNHTKEAIADVRKRDITVIAMSLVEDVVHANNEIYGQNWNVDASEDLRRKFQKIITHISNR